MEEIRNVLHFIFPITCNSQGSKSFASLDEVFFSLAFHTLSLLDLISSSGIRVMSLAE